MKSKIKQEIRKERRDNSLMLLVTFWPFWASAIVLAGWLIIK